MVYVAEPATIINERNKNKLYNKKLWEKGMSQLRLMSI